MSHCSYAECILDIVINLFPHMDLQYLRKEVDLDKFVKWRQRQCVAYIHVKAAGKRLFSTPLAMVHLLVQLNQLWALSVCLWLCLSLLILNCCILSWSFPSSAYRECVVHLTTWDMAFSCISRYSLYTVHPTPCVWSSLCGRWLSLNALPKTRLCDESVYARNELVEIVLFECSFFYE